MTRPRFVCASANPGKVAELAELLGPSIELVLRPMDVPDVVEDADTLAGNARLKAIAISTAAGAAAIADDTGLFVEAFGGAPGVRSARFAGEHATPAENRELLLVNLRGWPDRAASFRTVALVRWPDGREIRAEGVCSGRIAEDERGVGGFGYDSVFIPDEGDGRTFAEMTADEKHALSHRGRAIRSLLAALGAELTS